MSKHLLVGIAVLLLGATASAETPASDATQQARSHFQSGLQRAQQGDLLSALREFETAYTLRPHFSVLYNIGQAHSTVGHPVEAVAAFERYLADGGEQVSAERRQEVEALLAVNRARIGQLRVIGEPGSHTRVWLDGAELESQKLGSPIAIATGQHVILYSDGNGFPQSQAFSVGNDKVTEVTLAVPPHHPAGVAQLAIECETPGVDVEIDGVARKKTPLPGPVLVPIGPLSVRFLRPGYETRSQTLTLNPGELRTVHCEERQTRPLPASITAPLDVRIAPADAEVVLDGRPFQGGPLPAGLHHIRIERDGFIPQERLLSLSAGKRAIYEAQLSPTLATRQRDHRALAHRKTTGIVLASIGTALLATAVGVYAWNSGRYDDWHKKQNQLTAGENTRTATSIQRADDATIGLFALGGGLMVGGSWLFFSR